MMTVRMKAFQAAIFAVCAAFVVTGCDSGADRVASPGIGAFPPASPPAAPPAPPAPPSPPTGGPAADCPAGFTNGGTVAAGTLRACVLPNLITGTFLVPERAGTVYQISGRVNVGVDQGGNAASPLPVANGTITIEPGVTLFGSGGLDFLLVNRGSRIFAEGLVNKPIIFTSLADINGTQADPANARSEWGGIVIAGRAPINNCPGTFVYGDPGCEASIEGISGGTYGGNLSTDSSGRIRYIQVRYPGFEVSTDRELNGITLAGVGSSTSFEYVQVHNSSDDGVEWFGGTVNARYLVLTGNDDDSLDTDNGFNGAIQFVIATQRSAGGDRVIEASNLDGVTRTPVSRPRLSNFTFLARSGGGNGAIALNTATNFVLLNGIVVAPGSTRECVEIDNTPDTTATFRSVALDCPLDFEGAAGSGQLTDSTAIFGAATASNNNVLSANYTPTLAAPAGGTLTFVNGANETALVPTNPTTWNLGGTNSPIPAAGSSPANDILRRGLRLDSTFTDANFVGAVRNSSDTWWSGWTCGLVTATSC